ncbi:MAG: sigma-70 family RNA polymerase sigma factor [Deltaproteobacteria bacterium]|nr:sigma-70 family RNA polymerase sigma factor [Deltaproteobacteria bacterium]
MPRELDRAGFPVTRWSVVLRATARDGHAQRALGELCSTYWPPLYAYLRRRGVDRVDAEDLVQGFVARTLDQANLAGVDRERGRFRAYLLGAFKNFVAKQKRQAQALKRGGGVNSVSLDFEDAESRLTAGVPDARSPEAAYAHAWAMTVLQRTEERLRGEYTDKGNAALFEGLRGFLLGGDAPPYKDVATALTMTEGSVRVAVHRLRTQFRRHLREEVADTVVSGADIDAELRSLMDALRGPDGG